MEVGTFRTSQFLKNYETMRKNNGYVLTTVRKVFCSLPFFDLVSLSSLNFTFHYPLTSILLSPATSCILPDKQGSAAKTLVRFIAAEAALSCVFPTTITVVNLWPGRADSRGPANNSAAEEQVRNAVSRFLCVKTKNVSDLEQMTQCWHFFGWTCCKAELTRSSRKTASGLSQIHVDE